MKILRLLYFFAATGLVIVACSATRTSQQQQGVEGFIYIQRGNQMPAKNKPASKGKAYPTTIYIYQPATAATTTGNMPVFKQVHTKLVATVKTDSSGHFKVALPTGQYSAFLGYQDRYFAGETDGEGILNPLKINAGSTTHQNFTIRVNAVY
ncbi:hypothetical protein MUY27_11715 [Mucilaginibacter sp. RS28]|uniref:Carboxypeptidase regulatory-like domain-containing protein n=1 Tax=Mucilaginibacter straminoryzae TaxID=2932774 RepID=A0A9X2BBZ6_9SPHI|nr:hypothetical protein [Mucilaginibacter straminoryzae]MCJ8210377.1 hypothetical protein [Mucilaginibacter straminoryzae]